MSTQSHDHQISTTLETSPAIGKATMNLENGKLRWVVTQKPKGEYYFPDSVILSKQKGAVVEIAKQASPLVVSQMLSRKARENESEGRFDEALSLIERAIKQDPQDHTNYVTRGDVLMALSKFDTAIGAYSKALELCPANSQYIIKSHRGRCYVRTKQLDLAVTDLTVAIDTLKDKVANIKSLKPYLEKSYRGRAEAYTLLGKSDLASKDKTEANSLK